MTMLVKRTRGNQVSIPKQILVAAGIEKEDQYFDVQYRRGVICLKPISIEEKIPHCAYQELLRWAQKTEAGDKVFQSGREAVAHVRRLVKKPHA
jgi:hypothetical protein